MKSEWSFWRDLDFLQIESQRPGVRRMCEINGGRYDVSLRLEALTGGSSLPLQDAMKALIRPLLKQSMNKVIKV